MGCKKAVNASIKDYLTNEKREEHMSMKTFGKYFDKQARKKIKDHDGTVLII